MTTQTHKEEELNGIVKSRMPIFLIGNIWVSYSIDYKYLLIINAYQYLKKYILFTRKFNGSNRLTCNLPYYHYDNIIIEYKIPI